MTVDEFFDALERETKAAGVKWRLDDETPTSEGPATALRTTMPTGGECLCPLTFVALRLKGKWWGIHNYDHAAVDIGLETDLFPSRHADIIARSADIGNTPENRNRAPYRDRLLKACGIKEVS